MKPFLFSLLLLPLRLRVLKLLTFPTILKSHVRTPKE